MDGEALVLLDNNAEESAKELVSLENGAEKKCFCLVDLCKFFKIGDFVQIVSGTYKGSHGWVVGLNSKVLVFVLELGTNQEVSGLLITADIENLFSFSCLVL
jgi:hypothetical protein